MGAACGGLMSAELEQRVDRALADIEVGRFAGLTDLYDVMSQSVYLLARTITGDEDIAQQVTVEVFVEVWAAATHRPANSIPSPRWILDISCCRARAIENRVSVAPTRSDRRTIESVGR